MTTARRHFLLPLWEKVDWRAAPRRMRGVGRSAVGAKLEHPSSVAFGDTFSHKGRRENVLLQQPRLLGLAAQVLARAWAELLDHQSGRQ